MIQSPKFHIIILNLNIALHYLKMNTGYFEMM